MKPNYSFFKNARYAIDGLIEVFKNEKSFRIEVLAFFILSVVAFFLSYPLWVKFLLISVLFIPLIVELLNSAIERIVDLVTDEYKKLAKYAKDAAAAAVMVSLIFSGSIWIIVFIYFW